MVEKYEEGTLDCRRGNLQAILAVVSQRCVCFVMGSWRLNRVILQVTWGLCQQDHVVTATLGCLVKKSDQVSGWLPHASERLAALPLRDPDLTTKGPSSRCPTQLTASW